jgi:hypothetical protein
LGSRMAAWTELNSAEYSVDLWACGKAEPKVKNMADPRAARRVVQLAYRLAAAWVAGSVAKSAAP